MTTLEILRYPDPRLRTPSRPVEVFDEDLARSVDDLVETMAAHRPCIGLSAPQVGDHRQILVMELEPGAPEVYVNPEVLLAERPTFAEERCLSVPGAVANVWRATRIQVRAQDSRGGRFERALEGMPAVCLQHEIDHFSGKLLVDHMIFFRRMLYERRVRRMASSTPETAPRPLT